MGLQDIFLQPDLSGVVM